MLLNDNNLNIEKSDGIYSPTFVVNEFSFTSIHIFFYTFKICISDFLN